MTVLRDSRGSGGVDGLQGADQRGEALDIQEKALPSGRVVVSCSAPLGVGGLGRHLNEIVDALHRREQATVRIDGSGYEDSRAGHRGPRLPTRSTVLARLPVRFSAATRLWAYSVDFDAYAARRLPAAEHLIAFNGTALAQIHAARRAHYGSSSLISANSHLRRVVRQHAKARRRYPLEGSWADHLVRRNVAEYARVDRIYV